MSTFSYSPADPTKSKSIRLLSILPGGTEAPLLCRLNEYASDSENDLYNSVCYEALSYTWGDDSENQKREITLNGCPFAVTANLYAALQVLRKEDRERVIWVDAICINQNDIEDKERQVRHMHIIYEKASRVLAWLGPAFEDSTLAMKLCETIYQCYYPSRVSPSDEILIMALPDRVSRMGAVDHLIVPEGAPSWRALFRLIAREYWKRAWILQEFVLPEEVLVCCGIEEQHWRCFSAAICVLEDNYDSLILLINSSGSRDTGYGSPDYWHSIHLSKAMNVMFSKSLRLGHLHQHITNLGSSSNVQWLGYNRSRDCKLPHDNVYSLLGLVDRQLRERIEVDYGQPVEKLYCAIVKSCVELTKSLDILTRSQHSLRQTFASWAPDWSQNGRVTPFSASTTALHPQYVFSAKATFDEEFSMTVEGFRVACVAGNRIVEKFYKEPFTQSITEHERNTAQNDPIPPLWTFHRYVEDIFAMAKEVFLDNNPVWEMNEEVFLQSLTIIMKRREQGAAITDLRETWQGEWNQQFEEWNSNLTVDTIVGRTVIRTEKGFLGLAPDFSARGDIVAVLPGLNTLALLRPRNDEKKSYMWIGQVWISEYMHGRAVDDFFAEIDPSTHRNNDRYICIQVIHSGGTKIKFPSQKENAGDSKKIPGQFQLSSKTIIRANSNTWFAKGMEIFLNLK